MRIVIALGGNALIQHGESADIATQRKNVGVACATISRLVEAGHEVVVTHGNGPQVGLLALQAAAYVDIEAYPLDVLDAESEGMVGYLLAQGLKNRLPRRDVIAVLNQVEVETDDPAFGHPTKPIGPFYDPPTAKVLAAERGWHFAETEHGHRRVVPSPNPTAIIEIDVVRRLVEDGTVVICVGGGGIPVVRDADDQLTGVEAVIDKDRASALLAEAINADLLVLLTDVPGVFMGWGTPGAALVLQTSPQDLRRQHFDEGSMGPKVEAACAFVERTGHPSVIGKLGDASGLVAARSGTRISMNSQFILLDPAERPNRPRTLV